MSSVYKNIYNTIILIKEFVSKRKNDKIPLEIMFLCIEEISPKNLSVLIKKKTV